MWPSFVWEFECFIHIKHWHPSKPSAPIYFLGHALMIKLTHFTTTTATCVQNLIHWYMMLQEEQNVCHVNGNVIVFMLFYIINYHCVFCELSLHCQIFLTLTYYLLGVCQSINTINVSRCFLS